MTAALSIGGRNIEIKLLLINNLAVLRHEHTRLHSVQTGLLMVASALYSKPGHLVVLATQ